MRLVEASDERFMLMALEEAGLAFSKGEVPVGAVLVRGGEVAARAHNLRETSGDPTAHAEVLAVRAGAAGGFLGGEGKGMNAEKLGWRLSDATLYVTKEPCVMCAGAMINARLGRLVFGCRDSKGGAESLFGVLSDERLNHKVAVTSGVLEEECAAMLKEFFGEKRGRKSGAGS